MERRRGCYEGRGEKRVRGGKGERREDRKERLRGRVSIHVCGCYSSGIAAGIFMSS